MKRFVGYLLLPVALVALTVEDTYYWAKGLVHDTVKRFRK